MESKINEVGKVAGAIKSIASVISGIVLAVSSAAFAYSKIFENERNLELFKLDAEKRYLLLIDRSDKRYKRMVDYVEGLKSMDQQDEGRIIELEKSHSEMKGYIKGIRENK